MKWGTSKTPRGVRLLIVLVRQALVNQQRIYDSTNQIKEMIRMASKEVQAQIDDLKKAVTVIGKGVDTITANLDTARGEIEKLRSNGVSDEQLADLSSAVDGVEAVADKLKAATDDDQPTPAVEDIPAPVSEQASNTETENANTGGTTAGLPDSPPPGESGISEGVGNTDAATGFNPSTALDNSANGDSTSEERTDS